MDILLIEDNPGDVLLAREALRELDLVHQLQVVQDGEGAICLLSELMSQPGRTPNLILLDLNLPGLSGLDVLSFIKEHQAWEHVPVVVFSTSDAEADIEACYARQANCFLTKPIGFDELVSMFQQVFRFWSRQSQVYRVSA